MNKLDAIGNLIQLGAIYGYSVHVSGVGKVTTGKAIKITKTGKVTLEVVSRKAYLYGEPCKETSCAARIDSPTVSVFSHILFKIADAEPSAELLLSRAKVLALDSQRNHHQDVEPCIEAHWDQLPEYLKKHFIEKAGRS